MQVRAKCLGITLARGELARTSGRSLLGRSLWWDAMLTYYWYLECEARGLLRVPGVSHAETSTVRTMAAPVKSKARR